MPFMLANLAAYHATLRQIVIVGQPDRSDTQALHRVVAHSYLPFAIVLPVTPGHQQARLAHALRFLQGLTERDGRATAYVCEGFSCQAPTTEPDELARQLGALA